MTDREKLTKAITSFPGGLDGLNVSTVKLFKFVNHLIANGVTVQRWIPVTERLPTRDDANETESILAVHKDDGFVGRWIWDIVVRYHTEFTHWMPLPEPPKEE